MGTHPYRRRGARPTLGTSVHRGKPKASPPCTADCGEPLGRTRDCGRTVSVKMQGFPAGAAGGRRDGGGTLGLKATSLAKPLQAPLSKGDKARKYRNTPRVLIRLHRKRKQTGVLTGRSSDKK